MRRSEKAHEQLVSDVREHAQRSHSARLPGEKFKAWVNLLCIASTHDGILPPVADLAFLLRPMGEDKVEALLAELHLKGLLDPVEAPGGAISYAPCRWSERQYRSDVTDPTAAARMQRYRDRKRNARNGQDRNDRNGDRNGDGPTL